MSQFVRRYLQACMDAGSFVGLLVGTIGLPFALLAFVCWWVFA
jgi:hypothetical protein